MTIRTMDDATKKALKALLPFAPGAYITTSLDCFDHIPEEFRPVFRLRDLTAEELYTVRAEANVKKEFMVKILQGGVMGQWENLTDNEFNEIPFTAEAIASLPLRWIETFFWAALKLCSPNKLEREVLESLQPSTSESSSKVAEGADVPLS